MDFGIFRLRNRFRHRLFCGVTRRSNAIEIGINPLGGERAGNKDGSIPAWSNNPVPYSDYKAGGARTDPFAGERPIFSVDSKNMDRYAEMLTDGAKAMLRKYPETYRIDVYPTHRTAMAPNWVYDNTYKNATRAKLENEVVKSAYGGIPFPIPKSGGEILTNSVLRWRGGTWHANIHAYMTTANGNHVFVGDSSLDQQQPYYFKDGSVDDFEKEGNFWLVRLLTSGPPLRSGEAIAGIQNVDDEKSQVWVYLPGQRRVRKLPSACCDTPAPPTAGLMSFDEINVFSGRIDKFNYKIVGKREIIVPYNTNKMMTALKDEDVFGNNHLNPDFVRWERHRVWVVDAELKPGLRHQAPKSRYYVDEDSWYALMADRWDAKGQLWKTIWSMPFAAPDMPGIASETYGFYDLISNAWFVQGLMTQQSKSQYKLIPKLKASIFTPDAMVGDGVR